MFTHRPSGTVLYPWRAYFSNLQRWGSRDPIGIAGGINLYGFVGNYPLDDLDPLGLAFSYSPDAQDVGLALTQGLPGPFPYIKSEGWGNDRWFDYGIGPLNNFISTAGNALYQSRSWAGCGRLAERRLGGQGAFGERAGETAYPFLLPEGRGAKAPCPQRALSEAEKRLYGTCIAPAGFSRSGLGGCKSC